MWDFGRELQELRKIRSEHTKNEWEILRKMWKLDYPYYAQRATITALRMATDPETAEAQVRRVLELGGDDDDMMEVVAPVILEAAGVEPVNKETDEVVNGTPVYKAQLEQTWSELDLLAVRGVFDDAVLDMLGVKLDREKMSLKEQIEIVKAATIAKYGKKSAAPEEQHPQE